MHSYPSLYHSRTLSLPSTIHSHLPFPPAFTYPYPYQNHHSLTDEALQQLKVLAPALTQVALPPIETTIALRERFFGQLDAQVLMWYNKVWPIDQIDAR